eukprot:UN0067
MEYRQSQWFRLLMEKLRMPFLLPRPCYIIIDQCEELMRRFPDEVVGWADSITHYHTRNNIARLVFVVNSENGTQTLTNLSWLGHRYHTVVMEPAKCERLWQLSLIDRKLFLKCNCNPGLYALVAGCLKQGTMSEAEVPQFVKRMSARWVRDFTLPFPLSTHATWLDMDLGQAKRHLLQGLAALLHTPDASIEEANKVHRLMGLVTSEINRLDSTQLFDASGPEWFKILSNQGTIRRGLSLPEAKVVAKHIRRLMGKAVDTSLVAHQKPTYVLFPKVGVVPKSALQRTKVNGHQRVVDR